MISTETWVLPRPRKHKYRGGFPLHFEKKLIRSLGIDETDKGRIFHPFGGMAEFGLRNDLNPNLDIEPDYTLDAHDLNLIPENSFNLVIVDPPYNEEYSTELYSQPKPRYGAYIKEAVRVSNKYVAMYHWVLTPRPEGTKLIKRIVILTRVWHRPRVCCVFEKDS